MELHLPSHLDNIEVVRQLKELLRQYNLTNTDSYLLSSMDGYLDSQIYDYIKEFITKIYSDSLDEPTLQYLINLFYDAKGTYKIFSLMETHLNMKFITDSSGNPQYPKYTIDELVVEFQEASGVALDEYYIMLKNFLYSLLYYHELSLTIELFNLYISSKLRSRSNLNLIKYKQFEFNYNEN